jgi:hypothetical protein
MTKITLTRDEITLTHDEAVENIAEALQGVDAWFLVQIYNSVCSESIEEIGDSLYVVHPCEE